LECPPLTGDWQTALSTMLSKEDTFTFQFRSAETPLPGAVWLFGSVLQGRLARANG
jgi:hypothetical protein